MSARCLVIAHRGASGDRPEHGLSAHRLAIEQGADVIEPDLVFSADGELLVRHDLDLARTTDIAERAEFSALSQIVEGERNWLAADLSWQQISQLRCRQPGRSDRSSAMASIASCVYRTC